MIAHLRYLKYVLRHKWFVFLGCRRFKVGLWQALIHDWTKFKPSEWHPYVNKFYRDGSPTQRKGYFHDPSQASDEFNRAWLQHVTWNPHHWQYWILNYGSDHELCVAMPEKYAREMLADWSGAGRAQGVTADPLPWYRENRDNIKIHPSTRIFVEEELGYI